MSLECSRCWHNHKVPNGLSCSCHCHDNGYNSFSTTITGTVTPASNTSETWTSGTWTPS